MTKKDTALISAVTCFISDRYAPRLNARARLQFNSHSDIQGDKNCTSIINKWRIITADAEHHTWGKPNYYLILTLKNNLFQRVYL